MDSESFDLCACSIMPGQILSVIHISVPGKELQVFTNLFRILYRSCAAVWFYKGESARIP
jgi:hypothetical protein